MTKPAWLKVKAPGSPRYRETQALIQLHRLHTVCEEAACPNIGECWSRGHATVMILGDTCTRACTFCNVKTGKPGMVDSEEPHRVARTVSHMKLSHVVITSVDRDDLDDGGASHFVETINAVRLVSPKTSIEVLTPDFLHKGKAYYPIVEAKPDVFNHNLETVPRLYAQVRPGARYFNSLDLLKRVKELSPQGFTKSGIMVGLGETKSEVYQVMDDMRSAGVDFLTIGQYLQPTPAHHDVKRFIPPEEFKEYADMAKGKGFLMVSSSPFTRSSYHADEDFALLKSQKLTMKKEKLC